jgi:L-alanine-DL-glutamate epimerase-like enolase superfamily enzyme
MKIKSIKLHPVVVERQYGTVIAKAGGKAKRTVAKSWFYFLELATDNGLTGWGEYSDIEPDALPKDIGAFAETLAMFTVGRDPFAVQQLHHDYNEHFDIANDAMASAGRCAMDMAFYDLQGQATRRPVCDLLGGAIRRAVTVSWVAYIREELDLVREEIREKTKAGFTAYKLKVGVNIDLDEERLAIARKEAGPRASIKVDANEGWDIPTAIKNIKRLDKYNLAGVETPVPRADPRDIAAVRRRVKVPILEHVKNLEYAHALVHAGAVDVFNIATTGNGGLWNARQVVAVAQAAKLGILLGSTVELGPGTNAQLHLAATIPNLTLPSDLIGPGLYKQHILKKPHQYVKGQLHVPKGVGLGGDVDRGQLKALAF